MDTVVIFCQFYSAEKNNRGTFSSAHYFCKHKKFLVLRRIQTRLHPPATVIPAVSTKPSGGSKLAN